MKRFLTAVFALVATIGSCTYIGQTKRYDPPGIQAVGTPDTGQQWFQRNCAWCHGDRGQGTPNGPSLLAGQNGPALTDFVLQTGRMPIQDPGDRVERKPPAYSQETIRKIVAYVSTLGATGPGIPTPDPAAGDLALGLALYQENCAACHSSTGIGGTLAESRSTVPGTVGRRSSAEIPSVLRSTAVEIVEAMRTGPGTMPVFDAKTVTNEEADSIARYVLSLRDANQRGGGDLGRVGPVTEGAVAWIVGIGALLLLARWIGKTVREHG